MVVNIVALKGSRIVQNKPVDMPLSMGGTISLAGVQKEKVS